MAKKILVIDDDLFIRDIYTEVLKNAGFDVDSSSNGEDGLKKLQKGGFDLVLLDVIMPVLSGLEVLKRLKSSGTQQKNGPIILLTNISDEKGTQEGVQNGAATYFIKSDLTPDQLLDNVNKFLK